MCTLVGAVSAVVGYVLASAAIRRLRKRRRA